MSDVPPSSDRAPCLPENGAHLSLWDSICLIIGIIIGASIYQAAPEIFRNVDGPGMGMLAWGLGGIVSLIGALCYAELASAYRTSGGDYTFLSRAYGPKVGFIFAWAELSVIRTGGSIAFMSYVFANYAEQFYSLGQHSKLIYAVSGILVLTLINAIGVRPGRVVQNTLTVANLIGLCGIVLIGLYCFLFPIGGLNAESRMAVQITSTIGAAAAASPESIGATSCGQLPEPFFASFALAMVLVFYAYGGWNEAAFIASEVKEPRRNVRRALILGTLIVTALYMLVNLAYLSALGYTGVCNSKAIAGDMFAVPFGETGRKAISALVMISALGSVNGLLFTGMRLYGTFGSDHKVFAWLAGKGERPHVARGALFAQAAFSLLLIGVVELATEWRQLLAAIAPYFGIELSSDFHQKGGIYRLVTCTAPVFWVFFFLTGCSLFILRFRDPDRERPYRVPLYPFLPLLFCAACLFMLFRSASYALDEEPAEAIIVIGLMLIGLPLMWVSARKGDGARYEEK
jgi:APA family basic amino acid/polyamine antiporter